MQSAPATFADYFKPLHDLIGLKLAEFDGFMCLYIKKIGATLVVNKEC